MIRFDALPVGDFAPANQHRDFITCEEELPAAVVVAPGGITERGTLCTEVKYETTDDK